MELWIQQPTEPDRWFARFHQYLLLGSQRSLLATYKAESPQQREKALSSPKSWKSAAEEWNWKERAIAFDQHHQSADLDVWKERRSQLREQQWAIAQKLLKQAEAMLSVALADQKWTASDAAKYVDVAIALARQAAEVHNGDFNAAVLAVRKYGLEVRDTQKHSEFSDSEEGWLKSDEEISEFLEPYS